MPLIGKILIAAGIISSTLFFLKGNNAQLEESKDLVIKKEILTGSTFGIIASQAGIATDTVNSILEKTHKIYDLARIRAGKELVFVFDKANNSLKEMDYDIDTEEKLIIKNNSTTTEEVWGAEIKPIEYKIEVSTAEGTIDSSLYEAMIGQYLDERLIISLAEVFAWQIDFAAEIQKGDSFKVIYEKRFLNGNYVMPGKILAAKFIASGEEYKGFYFKGGDGKESYYDEKGKSLEKVFLKSPIQYKYISSGFSYGRVNPITMVVHPHRAIDYAANYGTPAVSIGDGTVVQAGWNGDYGISVTVRHNDTYTTIYGHFSSLAKGIKKGALVKQGQVVGYVGSTGQSTGPHLHYEMHKFGSLINPFKVEIPDGRPVQEADKSAIEEAKSKYVL